MQFQRLASQCCWLRKQDPYRVACQRLCAAKNVLTETNFIFLDSWIDGFLSKNPTFQFKSSHIKKNATIAIPS